jgi:glycosyltransferase involved in cell wall biosynthesis
VSGLRIVLVSRSFWPLLGGPEVNLTRLAAGLHARGAAVTVLTACWQPDWPETFEDRGVHVVRLAPPAGSRWATLAYIARLSRWLQHHQHEFDLVYVSELKHEAYAAMFASRRSGFPVVLRAEHAGLSGDCHWQLTAPCGRRIKRRCQQATSIVAPTAAVERELIAAGYPRDRLRVIRGGVPIAPDSAPDGRADARAALAQTNPHLSLAGAGPVAVYVGRLSAEAKGLSDLLQAWRKVVNILPKARLWIVGEGPDAERLRAEVAALDLVSSVAFAGAFDDVDDFLQAADLFVMPTRESRASMAMLEAMSWGLPIVATATGETQEFIQHGQQGWLVPPADPALLAEGILKLVQNQGLAASLGLGARRSASHEFNFARVVEQHWSLFQETLDRSRTVSAPAPGPTP